MTSAAQSRGVVATVMERLADSDTHLFPQQLSKTGAIPQVDPVADTALPLGIHGLAHNNPVEALGTSDGRTQPDLLVGRLFVQDIGAVGWEDDVEDAGLCLCQRVWMRTPHILRGRVYGIIEFKILLALLQLLDARDYLLEVLL